MYSYKNCHTWTTWPWLCHTISTVQFANCAKNCVTQFSNSQTVQNIFQIALHYLQSVHHSLWIYKFASCWT